MTWEQRARALIREMRIDARESDANGDAADPEQKYAARILAHFGLRKGKKP